MASEQQGYSVFGRRAYSLQYHEIFQNIYLTYKKRDDLKMFMEIILSLATIIFFLIVVLRPTSFTIAKLITDIQGKEDTLSIMNKKIDNLTRAQTLYDSESSRISLLTTAVPSQPFPQTYVRQIEGLGAKNSITIDSMTIEEVALLGKEKTQKKANSFKEISEDTKALSMGFNVSGVYSSLTNFIFELERLRRPILLQSFLMKIATTESESSGIVLSVTGQAPFITEEKNLSKQ